MQGKTSRTMFLAAGCEHVDVKIRCVRACTCAGLCTRKCRVSEPSPVLPLKAGTTQTQMQKPVNFIQFAVQKEQ